MTYRRCFFSAGMVAWLVLSGGLRAARAACIWLEGESARTTFDVNIAGWGRPQFLSASNWVHVSVEGDKVEKGVPDEGILLEYPFECTQGGRYEVWNRIGFEFVRSVFEWRLDDGGWRRVGSDELTTDLMELATWCEVAWLRMGEVDLAAGAHRLQLRLPKAKDDQGKWRRVLYASDAICLKQGAFQPNSKWKPGESGRDAADEAAARVVFQLPEAGPSERASVRLSGMWEIARDDEQLPGEVAEPIKELPRDPIWRAIPVPSDKNRAREDLLFAHRVWYRTRVWVAASMAGRAFYIDFPCNNLNTTVYVNGVCCGFEKNPFARFQVDVSEGIKAGGVNEIWVGTREAWYGRSADPQRPLKLRKTFNYPVGLFSQGFQDLDYPVWNCPQSGILATPTLVAAGGAVYAGDVFVKPSVARKRLEVEVVLKNATAVPVSGEIKWEAVHDGSGQTDQSFAPHPFEVVAGQTRTIVLGGAWTNPELWWPDAPHLYRLRLTVCVGGKAVDVSETRFGFREWRCEGKNFTLNGVVWRLWADLVGERRSPEDWIEAYRRTHQRIMRLSTAGQGGQDSRWFGLEPQDALEFFDRSGVVVRRNTTLDGETIG